MEKNYNTLRKTHFLRNKNKNEMDTEETRLTTQKTPVRDKYCQTDHNHHGCCESVSLLEPGDPPLLQQPVQTAKSGIQQIIECFRSGTKQLKLMLLKEVDTIFECKTCRSLFRGLPNLITHKQFYCLSKVHTDGNPPNEKDKQSQAIKDVLEAVYPKVDKPDYVITLEPIQSNRNAVFQYVTPVEDKNLGKGNASRSAQVQMEKPSAPKPVLIPEPEKTSLTESVKKDLSSSTLSESQSQIPIFAANPVKKASSSHPFSCRVCKKDFNCRRSIRRHIKRVHKKKLEDIKKFIEIQRMPTISTTKGTSKVVHTTSSTNCHVCKKSFATKANVRRHIDEVHKGMRRDSASHETAAKPGKSMALEIVSPKSPKTLPNTQKPSVNSDFSLSSCKCPHCKRRYTSRFLLKKHVQIVHKTTLSGIDFKQDKEHNNTANTDSKGKIESANTVDSTSSTPPAPQSELKGLNHANEKKNSLSAQKSKVKHDADSPKTSPGDKKKCRKPKLSAGFDFKQLYCKLCKRQFTSKQNLTKHIELHTDGNSIYVKFYRCPLCTYETRRKRDVIRHITVVHKKTQRALAKITANLESRAVKKPIESVLDKVLIKSGSQKDKTKRLPSRPDGISASPSKKINGGETSIEVKMTKNFSLLKCNKCGKAFAKKTDLDQHKKDHKGNLNSSPVDAKTKGRNTRSKTLL